jgi:hypothetical protein
MKAVRLDSQERGFPLVTDDSDRATPGSLCRDIILASDQHDAPKLEFRPSEPSPAPFTAHCYDS